MKKAELDYIIGSLDIIKNNARFGVDSQNHMEQVIFRRVYDDILTLRNWAARELRMLEVNESNVQETGE